MDKVEDLLARSRVPVERFLGDALQLGNLRQEGFTKLDRDE